MNNSSLEMLHEEHRSLGAVVHGIRHLARDAQSTGRAPDFRLLWTMLLYVTEFPQKLHHPKEETYIFSTLGERTGEAKDVIEELKCQHAEDLQLTREMKLALGDFEGGLPNGCAKFLECVEKFANLTWAHMNTEERVLVPLAQKYLTEEDWERIEQAFGANGDPKLGYGATKIFEEMFRRIANLAPAPIGFGS